jgi:hypothetical protein
LTSRLYTKPEWYWSQDGVHFNGKLALFVQGINLREFPAYVARFPLLVTFNGSQFDVPFLRAHFPGARLDQAHIADHKVQMDVRRPGQTHRDLDSLPQAGQRGWCADTGH